jgi:DNA-binding NarL/FixJ family response regulator
MRKSYSKKKVFEYLDKGLSATASAKVLNTTSSTVKSRLNEWGYVFKIING